MKAYLFCGGEGKRMRPMTFYMQKVMVPIGIHQRPVLEYVVRHLVRHGIREFVFLVGYKQEQIKGYFRNGDGFGASIEYVEDPPRFQGTGAALLHARETLEDTDEHFLVYFTDILTNADISAMIKYHYSHHKQATLLVSKGWTMPIGIAEVNEQGDVIEFKEKPKLEDIYVNTGIGVFHRSVFGELEEISVTQSRIDLSADLLPRLAAKGEIKAYITKAWWEDIGSIERYEKRNDEEISLQMEDHKLFERMY